VIRFENVGLRYDMGPEVLRDLSFEVKRQSFQFLTGPSGAGKTSLLRMLFLALKPTRGLITVLGRDASTLARKDLPSIRRRIGVVFQDFRLLEHLTTYENVALPLRVRGKDEASYRQDVIDLIKWVGLGERLNASPVVLSGGEKQRAAIARALIDHVLRELRRGQAVEISVVGTRDAVVGWSEQQPENNVHVHVQDYLGREHEVHLAAPSNHQPRLLLPW